MLSIVAGLILDPPATLSDLVLLLRCGRQPGDGRPLTEVIASFYFLDDDYPQSPATASSLLEGRKLRLLNPETAGGERPAVGEPQAHVPILESGAWEQHP